MEHHGFLCQVDNSNTVIHCKGCHKVVTTLSHYYYCLSKPQLCHHYRTVMMWAHHFMMTIVAMIVLRVIKIVLRVIKIIMVAIKIMLIVVVLMVIKTF